MARNNSQDIKMVCAILLIFYIPMLIGGIYNLPFLFSAPSFKDIIVGQYGGGIYSMILITAPLNIVILFFLVLGAILSIKRKSRLLLLIFSSGYILYAIITDMLFFLLGTSYTRFVVISSWAAAPRATVILSAFTLYYFTRPAVREQFKKEQPLGNNSDESSFDNRKHLES